MVIIYKGFKKFILTAKPTPKIPNRILTLNRSENNELVKNLKPCDQEWVPQNLE